MATKIQSIVEVQFCDGSTERREYENSSWHQLVGREFFNEMIIKGSSQHVLNVPPHPIVVTYTEGGVVDCQEFRCRCGKGKGATVSAIA